MQLESSNYDVILIGTGLVQSIVAAALCRIGKKCIILDSSQVYGQTWSTHNITTLSQFLEFHKNVKSIDSDSSSISVSNEIPLIFSIESTDLPQELVEKNKHFHIDIFPFLTFSQGPCISLLIKSHIGKYMEFRPLDHTYFFDSLKNNFTSVPASKRDIFRSRFSLEEKLSLIAFLELCGDSIAIEKENIHSAENQKKTFFTFMLEKGLSPKLALLVWDTLTISPFVFKNLPNASFEELESLSIQEGIQYTQQMLSSLGRYSNAAFLWPLYGSSEFPQAFTRFMSLFSGICCLRIGPQSFTVGNTREDPPPENDLPLFKWFPGEHVGSIQEPQSKQPESPNTVDPVASPSKPSNLPKPAQSPNIPKFCTSVFANNQDLTAQYFISGFDTLPQTCKATCQIIYSRAIFILKKPINDPSICFEIDDALLLSNSLIKGIKDTFPHQQIKLGPLYDISKKRSSGVFFSVIPASKNHVWPIHLIQLDHTTYSCPKGYWLLHLTTRNSFSPLTSHSSSLVPDNYIDSKQLFSPIFEKISQLANLQKDDICSSTFFDIPHYSIENPYDNLFIAPSAAQVSLDEAVKLSKEIFHKIVGPDQLFCPRGPDSEEYMIFKNLWDSGQKKKLPSDEIVSEPISSSATNSTPAGVGGE